MTEHKWTTVLGLLYSAVCDTALCYTAFLCAISLYSNVILMNSVQTREVQDKLDETADLIRKLEKAQSERLSQANETNGATPKSALVPSESEQSIGKKNL